MRGFNWMTMKKFYFVAALASLALLGGCSKIAEESNGVEVAKSELSIGLPIGISRTAMNDEGKASWIEGDTFTLWAQNRTGGFNINGADFTMMYYWHSLQSVVFTGNANTLPEGNYTYYAVSPKPVSINNRKATFNLPAEQSGDAVNGAHDFMVATPVTADALSTEKINDLALEFNHKTHLLKLVIPKGGNPLKEPIKQVVFTFPTIVTGNITIDATAPTEVPTISNGSKQLVVNIPQGFDEGETAWARIAEGNISGAVAYYTISTIGERSTTRTFNLSKMCEGGHITPFSLTIPEPIPPTTLRFVVGKNNLGEAVQKVSIYDYNGALVQTFSANSSNTYDLVQHGIYEDGKFLTYAGKTFTVRFESQNAIVEQKVTIPSTIAKNEVNTLATIDVPYLLFEDFSCVHKAGESWGDDNRSTGEERQQPGVNLDQYMYHSGWNAARFQLGVNTCIRINVRYQAVGAFVSTHHGRLDTPRLTGLKSGAKVNIKVQFDAGAHVDSDFGYNGTNCTILGVATHTDNASTINGVATGTAQSGSMKDYGTTFFEERLNDNYGTGDFGNTFPTFTDTTSDVTNATRLVFYPNTTISTGVWDTGNGECFIYIDNIRVSIAQ